MFLTLYTGDKRKHTFYSGYLLRLQLVDLGE